MFRALIITVAGLLGAGAAAAQPLVDGDWLQARLEDERLVVLDIRNPIDGGSRAAYQRRHIPGAVHSDYLNDGWRVQVDGVPAMLPPVAHLQRLIGGLGIGNDSHVVIVPGGVSAVDYASATRVYWTFKVLGHEGVSILDGGHGLWARQGRPLAAGIETRPARSFIARFRRELLATRDEVRAAMTDGTVLVDNRPPAQFMGKSPRPGGPRAGAIPGARNIPQGHFFDPRSRRFADLDTLTSLWSGDGLENEAQIMYCNTGHWASLGWFAASELLGRKNTRLYDGSMVEWSAYPELPVTPGGCTAC